MPIFVNPNRPQWQSPTTSQIGKNKERSESWTSASPSPSKATQSHRIASISLFHCIEQRLVLLSPNPTPSHPQRGWSILSHAKIRPLPFSLFLSFLPFFSLSVAVTVVASSAFPAFLPQNESKRLAHLCLGACNPHHHAQVLLSSDLSIERPKMRPKRPRR